MMNMGQYFRQAPLEVWYSQIALWKAYYRPLGAAFYLPLYHGFGLHPRPFRIAAFAILLINVWLLYGLVRLLGASDLASALAAFLACFHPIMGHLLINTSYCYDLLAFAFYVGALAWYVRARRDGRALRWWEATVFLLLYLCALNAKEIAVTLPFIVVAYECLYHERGRRWSFAAMFAAALTAVYVYGKTLAPGAMTANAAYRPDLSLRAWLTFQEHALAELFFSAWPLGVAGVSAIWAAVTAIAWLSRDRLLRLCWWWMVLAPLPIAFIDRTGPSFYLPYAGWAMFAAVVFARFCMWAARGRKVAIAALVLAGVIPYALACRQIRRDLYKPAMQTLAPLTRDVIRQLDELHPQFRAGERVVFLNDPFEAYDMLFIAQLWSRQRDINITLNRLNPLSPDEIASADAVFRFEDGRLLQVK